MPGPLSTYIMIEQVVEIMIEQVVEIARLGKMVVEKARVALGAHFRQQGGQRCLHIAHQRQIDGSALADMLGPVVDLHLLYALRRGLGGLRKRKSVPSNSKSSALLMAL
jgi:hypothetical protein